MPRVMPSLVRCLHPLPLVALLLAALWVRPAAAQFELTWDQCAGGFGARSDKQFACQDDMAQPFKLVVAVTPPTSLRKFVGYRVWIEISSSTQSLPDWWGLASGGCREGAVTVDYRPGSILGSCQNAWAGAQTAAAYSYFEQSTSPNRALFQIIAARTDAYSLASGTRYFGTLIQLSPAHSAGTDGGRCAGCSTEVCIAISQVELDEEQTPGSDEPNAVLITRSSQTNVATFNSQNPNGNPCGATNKTSTWGRIKTTYR